MLNAEPASGVTEDDSDAVQVLAIKGNRIYLSHEVRAAFNLRDGDKVVVYNNAGAMSLRIIRKPGVRPFRNVPQGDVR